MALARFTRSYLSLVHHHTTCDVSKLPLRNAQRKFSFGKVRMDKAKANENTDLIEVDGLSKIALVVDRKYKSLKDVPAFLPYGTVYKARDKFRVKASVGTSLFLVTLMLYAIKKNQHLKKIEQYELYMSMEEAKAEAGKK